MYTPQPYSPGCHLLDKNIRPPPFLRGNHSNELSFHPASIQQNLVLHHQPENNVQVGDVAPDFVVSTQDGKITHLSDFRGEKAVVVYFYPKDDTPGCTAEACTFRDSYEEFKEA